ncbi:aldehyde dehydrogenase family protein [Klebsiella indica]|uniref:aldehyde dehydrogenase family protein n=1 Tax=Klebsiella TaxID=570 RepID=UPI00115B1EAA|nr:aldehyde dehydrogenase family protein [Klebsiella sp. 2680]
MNTHQHAYTGQYINGNWRPGASGTPLIDINPFNQSVLTEIAQASQADLDEAYRSAAIAQKAWAGTSVAHRSAVLLNVVHIMEQRHDEIVDWLIAESGSTRIKAEIEYASARDCTFAAAMLPGRVQGIIPPSDVPGRENRIYRSPLGVIGVISPWNFPLHLSNRSVAPALALGNAVVLKPAEDTPVTGGLLLASIYEQAGLPPGVLNVVIGDVQEIGDAFTLHPVPRLISFTGSTRVGRHIGKLAATGPTLKHVGLELGGNAPCVVLDDADIALAVDGAIVGRFLHQGQICMSSNRIIIDASIYPRFTEAFVERARQLKVGDPNEPDTVIGPLINHKQLNAALSRIQSARQAGIALALGGEADGCLLPPHVFIDVPNHADLAQSEQFAPIAPLIKADNEAHALTLANETEFGLSSAVFTRDEGRGMRFARQIEAGMTHINDISPNDDPYCMFGGEKNSGLGRFNGDWMIAEFTTEHWISVQNSRLSYPF